MLAEAHHLGNSWLVFADPLSCFKMLWVRDSEVAISYPLAVAQILFDELRHPPAAVLS